MGELRKKGKNRTDKLGVQMTQTHCVLKMTNIRHIHSVYNIQCVDDRKILVKKTLVSYPKYTDQI